MKLLSLVLGFLVSLPGGGPGQASGLAVLDRAIDLHLEGRLREALAAYREAVGRLESEGDLESLVVGALNGSAAASKLGLYEESFALSSRALEASRETGDLEAESASENNLGLACRYMGRFEEALAHYRRALHLNDARGDDEGVVRNLNNMAVVHLGTGSFSDALRRCREALARCDTTKDAWGAHQRQVALANLASVLEKMGETRSAHEIYREVLEDGGDTGILGPIQVGLGRTLIDLGSPHRAIECFQQALAIFEETGNAGAQSNALLHLGAVYCEVLDDHARARLHFKRALDVADSIEDRTERLFDRLYLARCLLHDEEVNRAREEFERARREAAEIGSREGAWSALRGLGSCAEALGERERALRLYEECLERIERVRVDHVPEVYRATFFEDKQDVPAAVVGLLLGLPGDPSSDPQVIARAFDVVQRTRARSLLDRLGADPVTADDLMNGVLGDDEAIIEFLVVEKTIVAFVVVGREIRCIVAGHDLDRLPAGFARKLAAGDEEAGRQATRISEALAAPILSLLPSRIRRWILVPVGGFFDVPFGLLPFPGREGGARILLDSFEIDHVPSSSVLAALRRRPAPAPEEPVVVFADPTVPDVAEVDVGTSTLGRLVERFALQPLPASRAEATAISRRLPVEPIVRLGPSATREAFLGLATRPTRILHLAVHAVVDPARPEASALLLSAGSASTDEEGVLRAGQIAASCVPAELVVISSCRSGDGKRIRGEGVLGLAAAFLRAGARAVICTSDRLDDRAATRFMDRLYAHLAAGISPSASLRRARLELRQRGDASVDWALFRIVGDGVRPLFPSRTVGRVVWALVAGVASGVFVFGALVVIRSRLARSHGESTEPPRPRG